MQQPWDSAFPLIKGQGYVGIETSVPDTNHHAQFEKLLHASSLSYIAQIYTDGQSLKEHTESFQRVIDSALPLSPVLINCHAGSDSFSEIEAMSFFDMALRICERVNVPVAFETHRSRILFNPWITRRLIAEFPTLQLCADYSHWVCVCERLLDEADELFLACAKRVIHIHARVGYEQGPQVSDPRAPEFAAAVARHEEWWRMIWSVQLRRELPHSTMVPEFGPPNYLQTQPHSRIPLANLEEICLWQANRQRAHFKNFLSQSSHDRSG